MKVDKLTLVDYYGSNELLVEKKSSKELVFVCNGKKDNLREKLSSALDRKHIVVDEKSYETLSKLNYEDADSKTQKIVEVTKLNQLNGRIQNLNIRKGIFNTGAVAFSATAGIGIVKILASDMSTRNNIIHVGAATVAISIGLMCALVSAADEKGIDILKDERAMLLQRKLNA